MLNSSLAALAAASNCPASPFKHTTQHCDWDWIERCLRDQTSKPSQSAIFCHVGSSEFGPQPLLTARHRKRCCPTRREWGISRVWNCRRKKCPVKLLHLCRGIGRTRNLPLLGEHLFLFFIFPDEPLPQPRLLEIAVVPVHLFHAWFWNGIFLDALEPLKVVLSGQDLMLKVAFGPNVLQVGKRRPFCWGSSRCSQAEAKASKSAGSRHRRQARVCPASAQSCHHPAAQSP